MTIRGIFHVNLNCADYEVSRDFYRGLGFRVMLEFPEGEYPIVGGGLGLARHRVKGGLLAIGGDDAPAFLDLLEWAEPRTEGGRPTLTSVGIPRIALWTSDLAAVEARLQALGVATLAPTVDVSGTGGPISRFLAFRDPDGNVVEVVQYRDGSQGWGRPAALLAHE